MEKELKVEIPQGYEIDKEKSTFEKIVFKKNDNRPETWEDYCKLNQLKDSFVPVYGNCSAECSHTGLYDEFHTEERTEQFIALGKLLQLRDYWVNTDEECRYAISGCKSGVITIYTTESHLPNALKFPTDEMATRFVKCFRKLIQQAYPLV